MSAAVLRGSRPRCEAYIRVAHTDTCTWDGSDLIAVERFVNGEPIPLTDAEKIYAARALHDSGVPAKEIGRRLGVSHPTVLKWKAGKWRVWK